MKNGFLVSLIIVAGMLAAGCVTDTGQGNVRENVTISPTQTITPLVTATTEPMPTGTGLKGALTISIGGWRGEFPVSIDTLSVGEVATDRPLTLMIEEGNHTVEICCGMKCKQENVDIRFGKQRTIDFSEQLKRDLEFVVPTAQITRYRPDGDQIAIDIEFINPTQKPLTISADVSCGYSYIENRNYVRISSIAQGRVSATVEACDRITKTLRFNLGTGFGYVYDNVPAITNIRSE